MEQEKVELLKLEPEFKISVDRYIEFIRENNLEDFMIIQDTKLAPNLSFYISLLHKIQST